MKIVADENIPMVKELFKNIGEVYAISGRSINNIAVKEADILLVRSVTKVDDILLNSSKVSFVGTATSGCEHIDLSFLKKKDIKFVDTKGVNATSVVEYIFSVLFALEEGYGFHWQSKSFGIVGLGNIGSTLLERLQRFGITCYGYDPLIAPINGINWCNTMEKLLQVSDIVTFHCPLTITGKHSTYHMLNPTSIPHLKPSALLINTARGAVIDTKAIIKAFNAKKIEHLVFDVWENEPQIDLSIVQYASIATPHIAGYSYDGKLKASRHLFKMVCQHFGISAKKILELNKIPKPNITIVHLKEDITLKDSLKTLIPIVYDVRIDHMRMKQVLHNIPTNEIGLGFDRLRKLYPKRREFESLKVVLRKEQVEVINGLSNFGFQVEISNK